MWTLQSAVVFVWSLGVTDALNSEPVTCLEGPDCLVTVRHNKTSLMETYEASVELPKTCSRLTNRDNVLYTMGIDVGTPSVKFDVVCDTGSDIMVIPYAGCSSCIRKSKATYNATKSDTGSMLNYAVEIEYGSGSISGPMAVDKITALGMTVEKQEFTAMSQESLDNYERYKFDGIFGLGKRHQTAEEIEEMAKKAKQVSNKSGSTLVMKKYRARPFLKNAGVEAFSICLSRNGDGDIIVGQDPSLEFATVMTKGDFHWELPLNGFQLSSEYSSPTQLSHCRNENCSAIVDSGTTLIMGPGDQIDEVYARLCDSIEGCAGDNTTAKADSFLEWLMACPKTMMQLPRIEFLLGDKYIGLDPVNYLMVTHKRSTSFLSESPADAEGITKVLKSMLNKRLHEKAMQMLEKEDTSHLCTTVFMEMGSTLSSGENDPMWILGMPVMRQYTVLFDQGSDDIGNGPSVGFAQTERCCGACGNCASSSALLESAHDSMESELMEDEEHLKFLDQFQKIVPKMAPRTFDIEKFQSR